MTDWDVLSPLAQESPVNEEEEMFEEEEYDEFFNSEDEFNYSYEPEHSIPQRITASSFQVRPLQVDECISNFRATHRSTRSKRADRLAYRHKAGDGIRKGHLNTGNDIEDALAIYNDGGEFYDAEKLRESSAADLIPDYNATQTSVSNGCGSKNIIITKVRRGSMSKKRPAKEDIISTKMDKDPKHYWDHVSHQLMEDGQFVQAKYDTFHSLALDERNKEGIGKSAEMNSLYCFWCFYLRDHFDQTMYDEFLKLALEDNNSKSHYGIECYFRFCSYGLEKNWNEKVFKDFESEAYKDYLKKSYYGLEKLKAFLVNQKFEFEIPVDPKMSKLLATFPTMKSFREREARALKAEKRAKKLRGEQNASQHPMKQEKKQAAEKNAKQAPAERKSSDSKKKPAEKPHNTIELPKHAKEQPRPQPVPQPDPHSGARGGRRNAPRRRSSGSGQWPLQPSSAPMRSQLGKHW